ncbi:hypothetical protein PV327_004329 [Microctonus hyperodae]|uniref:4-nitrophenylphosphatase n=1 Tax=Microctonus hyperodae TaxID=165561 RepID=A0AA39FCG1_MICHY|nr:hypothetical protein PV327_004329 [Microctonus hyperodae]
MNKLKDIRNLSMEQRAEFLNSFDIVMTDCDGVLWINETPINGAFNTLKMFQLLNKKIVFVSNNSSRSVEGFVNKFRRMDYETTSDQIIIPTLTIPWYLKKIGFTGKAFVIGTQAFIKILEENGIEVITGLNFVEENETTVYKILSSLPEVDAIIMDFDINLNLIKLTQITALLKKKKILFLVGTRDKAVVMPDNISIIGPGHFVDIIINCTDIEPIEYAKPSKILKDYLFECFSIKNPERCLFIGDSLSVDMKFAELCGFTKLWVSSGVDDISLLYSSCIIPDYYLPNLGLMPSLKN